LCADFAQQRPLCDGDDSTGLDEFSHQLSSEVMAWCQKDLKKMEEWGLAVLILGYSPMMLQDSARPG
jgi:hypothetical protein